MSVWKPVKHKGLETGVMRTIEVSDTAAGHGNNGVLCLLQLSALHLC